LKVLIVDGFSAGAQLAKELTSRGVVCDSVWSETPIDPYLIDSFDGSSFRRHWGVLWRDIATSLKNESYDVVIPGSEAGVLCSDELAASLGTPANVASLSAARRDKWQMVKAWRNAGVATPESAIAVSPAEALRVADGFRGPYVVKPLDSAGGDGLFLCDDVTEVGEAAASVLASWNFQGHQNVAALVQRRVTGTEYCVNSVSYEGSHAIIDMWYYGKLSQGHGLVYDYEAPAGPEHVGDPAIQRFVHAALDALGVTFGASHLEFILEDGRPVAIECAARLEGGVDFEFLRTVGDYSSMHALADVVTGGCLPTRTFRLAARQNVRCVYLINSEYGNATEAGISALLARLPTVAHTNVHVTNGKALEPTSSLGDSPGYVYLHGESEAEVLRDHVAIRCAERAGIYTDHRAVRGNGPASPHDRSHEQQQ
jgi:biotin carboxylase